ncbi:protein affecting phage T7 exclusion by the F plasmid [Actinoalloteichus hymeniacidonis]|uniref:Protein affecting phage T7 exclusion by the F plasmid n=1 Tax=Actinoalloteichus hymeniacidonis TaxID=340345 RepID=A0AAC9HQ25_9PSEU|nr:protein affecting phage T7 exclusion by the F plasmid [Actinoalloteichus hymeniacidonis]
MPLFPLLFLILEITALIVVGNLIGVLPTILLVVGGSVLGAYLLRREGSKAMAAVQETMRTRRIATDSPDPIGIVVALLFLIPGLVTTFSGLLLMIPVSKRLVADRLRRSNRFVTQPGAGGFVPGPAGAPHRGAPAGGSVVEGEVIDGEVISENVEPHSSTSETDRTGSTSGSSERPLPPTDRD